MKKPKFELPEINVGYLINHTSLYLKISALQTFKQKEFVITPEQFSILYILSMENGLYQRQLSQITLKDRPNITRLVDILEEKNFVYRETDPDNRRIYKVFITDSGRIQIQEILPAIISIINKALEGLLKEDIESLTRILNIIQYNLEETFKLQI